MDAHLPKRKKVNEVDKNLHYCFCPVWWVRLEQISVHLFFSHLLVLHTSFACYPALGYSSRVEIATWEHNFKETEKRETTLPLAIVACLCSRHILSQYFDSYLLQVRKKRKVKGCQGEGGCWRGSVKKLPRVSVKRRAEESYPSSDAIPRTYKARGLGAVGSSVPSNSRTPLGFSSPSSAALRRSGGGLGCWRRPGERRRWQRRLKGKVV